VLYVGFLTGGLRLAAMLADGLLVLVSGAAVSLSEFAGQRLRGRLAYRQPMTQRLETRLNPHAPIVLSLFRIFFGLLFLCHGTSLLFGWPAATVAATGSLVWLSGLIELITGILITLGLFTRPAAFIASGEMAVAYHPTPSARVLADRQRR
jgi:DoxX